MSQNMRNKIAAEGATQTTYTGKPESIGIKGHVAARLLLIFFLKLRDICSVS